MKKEAEILQCEVSVYKKDVERLGDNLQSEININLFNQLNQNIVYNKDTLPVRIFKKSEDDNIETYRLETVIISKEEFKRLKEIEYMYNDLCK